MRTDFSAEYPQITTWEVILDCIKLDNVRIPRAVATRPDRAALKAVLVRVRMLVVTRARKVRVIIRRFVQVIMVFIKVSSLSMIVLRSLSDCQRVLFGRVTGC